MSEEFYEIDEFEDVVGSLRMLSVALADGSPNRIDVKWAILSAHSALQGACVCILTRTDGSGALKKDAEKELRTYLEARSQEAMRDATPGRNITIPLPSAPRPYIAPLRQLALRLPNDISFSIAKDGVWPNDERDKHFTLLSRWRDEFTHYPPQTWLIDQEFVLPIIQSAVSKIKSITSHAGFARRNRFGETAVFDVIAEVEEKLRTDN